MRSLDDEGGAEPGPTALRSFLDELHVAQELLDRQDPTLGERLLAAGLVVIGVLLEVAEFTGRDDPGDDRRPGHGGQFEQLGLERRHTFCG